MKNQFIIKRCLKCGATVEVIKDCTCDNCGIRCCNEQMVAVEPNTVDASVEKHKPTYEVVGEFIVVNVDHVMEAEHYIEYIAIDGTNINAKKFFNAGETAKAVFPYIKGSVVYAYCNKHGMWSTEVE